MLTWQQLRALGRLLAPTGLQLIAAIVPLGVYIVNDQGSELLSMLGEDLAGGTLAGWARPGWFMFANFLAGTAIWWTARVVLDLRFDAENPGSLLPQEVRDPVLLWWPRILGVLPVLIIAIALFVKTAQYKTSGSVDYKNKLIELGVANVVLAVAMMALFTIRRKVFPKLHAPGAGFTSLKKMADKSAVSVTIHRWLLFISAGIVLSLWTGPIGVSTYVGAGAILSLGAAVTVVLGTWLMHFRAVTGAPVIFVLVCLVFIFSYSNDNHKIRLSPKTVTVPEGKNVADTFASWIESLPPFPRRADGKARLRPIFIVATEGGGIRAAYWTATILASLQEPHEQIASKNSEVTIAPDFATNVFVISGVSGGSVGAAVFDGLIADKKTNLAATAQTILSVDHLAPLICGLLFPESVQSLWPWPLPHTDRAAMIETSFERAYLDATTIKDGKGKVLMPGSDRLAESFQSLWSSSDHRAAQHVPHLIFNSTLVETGQRLIFSDIAITTTGSVPEFLDAVDARNELSGRDIPLITAAHASARFTYTNPQGTISPGKHFVDGGYFEDSGAASAFEVLRVVKSVIAKREALPATDPLEKFYPIVIMISNSPRKVPDQLKFALQNRSVGPVINPNSDELAQLTAMINAIPLCSSDAPIEKTRHSSTPVMNLLAPPIALLDARGARGQMARAAIRAEGTPVIEFYLSDEGIPLPLGWSLSKGAAADMQSQAWNYANNPARHAVVETLRLQAEP
jgi:hypothetical protein